MSWADAISITALDSRTDYGEIENATAGELDDWPIWLTFHALPEPFCGISAQTFTLPQLLLDGEAIEKSYASLSKSVPFGAT